MKKNLFILLISLLLINNAYSQGKADVNLQIKTMHYWRGLKVTNSAMAGTSVGYFADKFSAFAWGGMSFDGSYKEVTNILSYKPGKLSFTLIDIYNFSGLEEIEYFNYKKGETGHLVDLTVGYNFDFMNFSWSTILYGNDLNAAGDHRYSTYVLLQVPFEVDGITFAPYIAPAFALNGDAEQMLYGDDNFGIANVGFSVSKTITTSAKEWPVSATLGYNTILNQASIQLAIDIF